ncbi:MAG TPA: hypothetical protein PKA98_19425, partial [Acidimicrobiales bacterium]|nr:hypothetical protein [Acidimicrobiales bacterium]
MSAALGEWLAALLAAGLGVAILVQWLRLRPLHRPRADAAPRRAVPAEGAPLASPPPREPRPPRPPRRRRRPDVAARGPFVAAVAVGGLVRLVWVIVATRTPTGLRDPAEYLRIAVAFSEGETLRFGGGGDPSAFWPPGYPALLAPFVWLTRQTGWSNTAFTAFLVTVLAGAAGVGHRAWGGPRGVGRDTRNP